MTDPGCRFCRGARLISGGPYLQQYAVGEYATLFRCRECSTFWVDAFGQYPRAVTAAQAEVEFPGAVDDARPDDGSTWLRD